ncbi:DHH family phosphoesterase [Gorillibacterium sp. sgz5001074]|uniref:DHH family phosphoesterase n=1 Tax=Gorillibacterium sp. sgz5001074 TaxID=3446695 RepID=UPI003F671506
MIQLFTHNDLDAVGCGIVARCAFGDKVDIRYNSVSGLDAQLARYLEKARDRSKKVSLFITDLTVNEANEVALQEYAESGGKVRLLDHHKTALHLNRHAWASVQVEYEDGRMASATSLFYDYLVQHGLLQARRAIAEFVELVRQYDTWEWERKGNVRAKRLNDLFFLLSLDDFEELMVERLAGREGFEFNEFEQKILDLEEEKIGRYVLRKKREVIQTQLAGKYVGIVHAESYHSELGHELGREYRHLDYIAILNVGGKKISLRTVHDHIDVSEIAAKYGGGGHQKAAGCSLTEEAFRRYVVEAFPLDPLRADAHKNEYNMKGSPYGVLFANRNEDQIFLFTAEGEWRVDLNGATLEQGFAVFEEAERFVKRSYAAWLVRDDAFIQYLLKHAGEGRKEFR